ncbi:hypothetical protein [Burkholderia sp. Ac-20365]|uniref:hypothetical protein n=1 Tax=Burkholderia sp. Ac-20365 TaxID=2703897 RepID=UPI00197BAB1D|nr:hypothetical protein [Burkholderia sp. Ac-20365]MBN3759363.1 hypothetical protein [Burkholderia sp. Ac-20365]
MKNTIGLAALLIAASLLAACTSVGDEAHATEALLSNAGFKTVPLGNLKAHELNSLTPGRIVKIGNGDVFVYEGPTACGCVLEGDRQAFERYQSEKFERDFHPAGAVPAAF